MNPIIAKLATSVIIASRRRRTDQNKKGEFHASFRRNRSTSHTVSGWEKYNNEGMVSQSEKEERRE